jgi:hypothetical protein
MDLMYFVHGGDIRVPVTALGYAWITEIKPLAFWQSPKCHATCQ